MVGWTVSLLELLLVFWASFHGLSLLTAQPPPHVPLLELVTGDTEAFRGRHSVLHAVFSRIGHHYMLETPMMVETAMLVYGIVELCAAGIVLLARWGRRDDVLATVGSGVLTVLHLAFYASLSAMPLNFAAQHSAVLAESLGIEMLAGFIVLLSLRSTILVEASTPNDTKGVADLEHTAAPPLLMSPQKTRNAGPLRRRPSRQWIKSQADATGRSPD